MPELFAQLTLHKFKLEVLSEGLKAYPTLFYGRRLQSCMGTRARLGYATFDAQLAYFVTTVYTIRIAYACIMLYRRSSHPLLMV